MNLIPLFGLVMGLYLLFRIAQHIGAMGTALVTELKNMNEHLENVHTAIIAIEISMMNDFKVRMNERNR